MNMAFDDENDILLFARLNIQCNTVLHFNNNSFNKKVLKCILDETGLIADNGHNAPPPDFYSETHNMMFDVLRINDSEVRKSYNPVKIRERECHKEMVRKFSCIAMPNARTLVMPEMNNVNEYTYRNYVRNAQRVIGEHVKKIPLWIQKCSNIKYKGLFIFDETLVYFDGISMPNGNTDSDKNWIFAMRPGSKLHEPWLDEKLIKQIYESDIDFVVWFCPYKTHGFAYEIRLSFPCMVIIDTRFYFDKYIAYPDNLVC